MLFQVGNPSLNKIIQATPVVQLDPWGMSANIGYAVPGTNNQQIDLYGISTGLVGRNENINLRGGALHLFHSKFNEVSGVQAALSAVAENVRGIQIGPFEAVTKEMRGLQYSVINAMTRVLYGWQHSEMIGAVSEKGVGFQYAGVGTYDGDFTGVRINWTGGFARSFRGLDLALVFTATESAEGAALRLGFLHYVKGSMIPLFPLLHFSLPVPKVKTASAS